MEFKMTNAIDHLSTLYFSPVIHKKLFLEFYINTKLRANNILLAYLILPLYFNSKTRLFFENANKKSSLITFVSKRERISNIEKKVHDFREITNRCLQMLVDENIIEIQENASIKVNFNQEPQYKNRFSENISRILSDNDVAVTYRMLGIKKL